MFDRALALQHLRDGDRVQSAHFAQVARFFQQAHVVARIQTILAFRALRMGEAELLPGANGGGRYPHPSRYVADFEIDLSVAWHEFPYEFW